MSDYIYTGSLTTYSRRMTACLTEMLRVLRPGARAFLVAGDVTIRRAHSAHQVRTAEVLSQVASSATFGGWRWNVDGIIEDEITAHSRYLFPVHKNGSSPALEAKRERILYLRKVSIAQPPDV